MKKVLAVVFSGLLAAALTSCSQSPTEISEQSPIIQEAAESSIQTEQSSEISLVSQVSEVSEKIQESSEVSVEKLPEVGKTDEPSKEISEISTEISREISENSKPLAEKNQEIADDTKQLIEEAVNVEELGEKTKSSVKSVFESREIYADITGEIEIMGGLGVSFNAQIARSDDGFMQNITLGGASVKTVQNSTGTYIVDDEEKTAVPTVDVTDGEHSGITPAGEILGSVSSALDMMDSLHYEKSGSETFNGKMYDFELYRADNTTVKVYFDGEKPKYIASTDQDQHTSVIEVHELSTTVDKALFEIPDDYQIISE